MNTPTIEHLVCTKIMTRAAFGKQKYGNTMERTDLNIYQWITHAQEEAMDLALYLEKIRQELDKLGVYKDNETTRT